MAFGFLEHDPRRVIRQLERERRAFKKNALGLEGAAGKVAKGYGSALTVLIRKTGAAIGSGTVDVAGVCCTNR